MAPVIYEGPPSHIGPKKPAMIPISALYGPKGLAVIDHGYNIHSGPVRHVAIASWRGRAW